jgi:hypothetical protein
MTAEQLIIAALACWRITALCVYEDGPFGIFMHMRSLSRRIGGEFERAFNCPLCLSIWVGAATAALALSIYWWVLLPFACSAVAITLDRYVHFRD